MIRPLPNLKSEVCYVLMILGLLTFGIGFWLIDPPAALILVGGALFGCGLIGSMR